MENDDFMDMVLEAHKRSYKRAFETAVRTGTALIFVRDGKLVEVRPPYRYELVKIPREEKDTEKAQEILKSFSPD